MPGIVMAFFGAVLALQPAAELSILAGGNPHGYPIRFSAASIVQLFCGAALLFVGGYFIFRPQRSAPQTQPEQTRDATPDRPAPENR
jgi:hypothetical protein